MIQPRFSAVRPPEAASLPTDAADAPTAAPAAAGDTRGPLSRPVGTAAIRLPAAGHGSAAGAVRDMPPLLSWQPAAIVFDCDGTLVDSERHWQDARAMTLREYGLRTAPGFADRAKGVHYAECGRLMAAESGRPELDTTLTTALLAHFRELAAARPTTMPGARELVAAVAGFAPLAVASNCPADVVETCLATAGLLPYFDHVVVPDSAVRPKPAPDVYLTAVRLCGAEPADCMAVEDSGCGAEAARRAGLRVLGVGAEPSGTLMSNVDLWVPRLDHPGLLAWSTRCAAQAPAR